MNARITPPLVALLALAAASLGCLDKSVTHQIVLEDDGSVSWTVIESGVRSVETDPARRASEDETYLKDARNEEIAAAAAMKELGADGVRVTVLRDAVPFHVVVTGRFASLEDVATAWETARLPGRLEIEGDGPEVALRVTADPGDWKAATEDETVVAVMLSEIDRLDVVPASGSFAEIEGLRPGSGELSASLEVRHERPDGQPLPSVWSLRRTPQLPSK